MTTVTSVAAATPSVPAAPVVVYDGRVPGSAPATREHIAADPVLATAARSARAVSSMLAKTFGRSGVDGNGSPLVIVPHAEDRMNNAYADVKRGATYLGDGDGKICTQLVTPDVIAHETGHLILQHELGAPRFTGQQGALGESFGDVLATAVDHNYTIGEGLYNGRTGFRDLTNPQYATMADARAHHVDEPHLLSGIPSLAAVRTAQTVGDDRMQRVWYEAFTNGLTAKQGFAGAARETIDAAKRLYADDASVATAVRTAWKSVGVTPAH